MAGGEHALAISCNLFEELQTVLFEVELIINNVPLTYVYQNTIETFGILFQIEILLKHPIICYLEDNYVLLTQHQL